MKEAGVTENPKEKHQTNKERLEKYYGEKVAFITQFSEQMLGNIEMQNKRQTRVTITLNPGDISYMSRELKIGMHEITNMEEKIISQDKHKDNER